MSPLQKAWDFLAKRSEEWGDMGAELARNPGPESDQPAEKVSADELALRRLIDFAAQHGYRETPRDEYYDDFEHLSYNAEDAKNYLHERNIPDPFPKASFAPMSGFSETDRTAPLDPAQQQLPSELTADATVADKDFRDAQFPRIRL